MQTPVQDFRFALRQLRKSPAFTLTAVLTLALGIGATTAIFSLVYQVILRSLPVQHPEQLYKVGKLNECCVDGGLEDDWTIFSFDLYHYLRDHTPGTAGIAAVQAGSNNVSARRSGETRATQPLNARFVSGNYFAVLGVQPFAGRLLTPEDDREVAPPAAVLSYTLWQTKFAADPRLVGSTLLLTGHPVTVVGIAAQNFFGERNTGDPSSIWLPLAQEPAFDPDRPLIKFPGSHWLDLLVRIPSPKQAPTVQLALETGLRQWIAANRDQFQPDMSARDVARQTTELVSASGGINELRDQYERSLRLLLLVAGFVLLIACANLANLTLVRGMARKQELAIRSALGAPRRRLVTQMLVEAVIVALLGGAAAIVLAYAGTRGILALAMRGVEVNPLVATPSLPVLGFALAVSLLTGILFGIAPAWISSHASPVQALRGANRSTRDASALPQRILVIAQAALSLALLSTAGLLITSLRHLEHQSFHFEPEGRLLAFIDLGAGGYTYDRLSGLYQSFDDQLTSLPGVSSLAYATYSPMNGGNWNGRIYMPGVADDPNSNRSVASYTAVSPRYFETLGTHVLLGRGISEQDTPTSTHVAVVNQTFADRFFAGRQPVGERFGNDDEKSSEFEIVGVVEDTKYRNPSQPVPPMYFTPIRQTTAYTDRREIAGEHAKHFAGNLVFQYRGDEQSVAASIRKALNNIDPNIPITQLRSYTDQVRDDFTQEELVVRLTTLFGALALILASVGLYGVTAYSVARRTGEIGIRLALGATRGGVLALILRSALTQAALGFALGIPLALGAARLLQHSLYQTSPFQPWVLVAVTVLLLLAALLAAFLPARRAAHLEPTVALRSE